MRELLTIPSQGMLGAWWWEKGGARRTTSDLPDKVTGETLQEIPHHASERTQTYKP